MTIPMTAVAKYQLKKKVMEPKIAKTMSIIPLISQSRPSLILIALTMLIVRKKVIRI